MEQDKYQQSQAPSLPPTPQITTSSHQREEREVCIDTDKADYTITNTTKRKLNKKRSFAIIVLFIALASIICLIFISILINVVEKATLNKEMQKIIVPASCTEKTKIFQKGDYIGSVPSWYIRYDCSDSVDDIFNNIKSTAQQKGYKIELDDTKNIALKYHIGKLCLVRNGQVSSWRYDENTFNKDGLPIRTNLSVEIHSAIYYSCQ